VVANGVLYASSGGKLYAYAVGCASGGGTCKPLWMAAAAANVGLAPAVADGVIYVPTSNSSAELAAYSVNCAQVTMNCLPQWTADSSWIASSPVIANGFVYVGSSVGSIGAYPWLARRARGRAIRVVPATRAPSALRLARRRWQHHLWLSRDR